MGAVNDFDTWAMGEALKQARQASECDEVPIGAVITLDERIIARGYNQTKTLNDATAHAEMIALTAASGLLNGRVLSQCSLYVTLEPCAMCAGAIFWSRIGRLIYAAQEPKHGYTRYEPDLLHPSTEVRSGILARESAEMLREFFNKKRK